MGSFLTKFNLSALTSFGRNGGFVALDIGSSSIKMVETSIERGGYRVLSLGVLPVPLDAIQNNMVVNAKLVADTIRRLVQENRVKSTQVVSAVPGRAVIMKRIEMPMQEEAELEANIEFEANNVIPERMENVNLDYQVVNAIAGGSKLDVLLVAVKKEIVNSYTEAIEEAGLKPVIMDVDYFAMENMYEANYSTEPGGGLVGLIHIGARYTSVTLLNNGMSTFTGDLPFGGDDFRDSLKRELNLSSEGAETAKITGMVDGKKGFDIEAMLKPTSENLAEEIRRTVTLYGTVGTEEGDGLKAIYLSGGSAQTVGLRAMLEQQLVVPVRMAEPFRGFNVDKKIDRHFITEDAPAFAVGAGLSIRRPGDK
jgi:type IV pilus assembly protein PilM